MRIASWLVALVVVVSLLGSACGRGTGPLTDQDQVHKTELVDIRLGDGVPLKLSLAIQGRTPLLGEPSPTPMSGVVGPLDW